MKAALALVLAGASAAAFWSARQAQPAPEPWAAVGYVGCSSVLIEPSWIVVPAHCVGRAAPPSVTFATAGEPKRVRRCVPHPQFDGNSSEFDLAVCELSEPAHEIAPAAIAVGSPTAAQAPGLAVQVVGFATEGGSSGMPVRRVLGARLSQFNGATTGLLQTSACFGDSGSAVFVDSGSGARLLGLVSAGEGGACTGRTIITRLGPAAAWLRASTQKGAARQ